MIDARDTGLPQPKIAMVRDRIPPPYRPVRREPQLSSYVRLR